MASKNAEVYAKVLANVIAELEKGSLEWVKPWATQGMPRNMDGRRYSGGNVLALWYMQHARSYALPIWGTFNQIRARGGQVRKGEKGTSVYFMKAFTPKSEHARAARDGDVPRNVFLARSYYVFNVAQCDGLEEYITKATKNIRRNVAQIHDAAEKIVAKHGARITFGDDRSYYSPTTDSIGMPNRETFDSTESYYNVLLHEHVHWTGAENRLARKIANMFGNEDYAKEELVAELGTAMVCATIGLEMIPQNAAYIQSWLGKLRGDVNYLVQAASAASKAADFLIGTESVEEEEEESEAIAA